MSKRFGITISIVEFDEDGDDLRELDGVTLDQATTDLPSLETVLSTLFDAGTEAMRRHVPEITMSDRRPPSPDPDDFA